MKRIACEHCGARAGHPVNLGAHGIATLCRRCEAACLADGPCPLGAECPEEHGAHTAQVALSSFRAT
jgi:hypothetical protein